MLFSGRAKSGERKIIPEKSDWTSFMIILEFVSSVGFNQSGGHERADLGEGLFCNRMDTVRYVVFCPQDVSPHGCRVGVLIEEIECLFQIVFVFGKSPGVPKIVTQSVGKYLFACGISGFFQIIRNVNRVSRSSFRTNSASL